MTSHSLEDAYPYTNLHDITSWGNISVTYHCENLRSHVYRQYHRLLYFLYNYKDAQGMVNGKVATVPKHRAMKIYRYIQNMNIEQRLCKSNLESLSNILPNSKSSPLNLEKLNTNSFLIVLTSLNIICKYIQKQRKYEHNKIN